MAVDQKYTFKILGTDDTKEMFRSLNASARAAVNTIGAIGTGAAAGLGVLVTRSIDASAQMTRLAESVGVGSKVMSEWSHAAETVNVEGDKMADIFKDVQDKIGDLATTGGGGAADLFKKMNLDIKDFIGLAPDQQLIKIGEALDSVQSQSEKIFFLESLAGDASRLLPLLENDAEKLRALTEEAEALGVSISDIDAQKLEGANRSLERVGKIATGLGNKFAIELSPFIEVLAEKLVTAATEGDNMGRVVKKGFSAGAKAAGVLADGLRGIQIVFKGAEVLARGFSSTMASALGSLSKMINEGFRNAIIDGIFFPVTKTLELLARASDVAAEALADVQQLSESVKASASSGFGSFVNEQKSAFEVAKADLQDLLMSDLPSTVIKENIDRIMTEAEALAVKRTAEARARLDQDVNGQNFESDEDAEAAKHVAQLAARLQRLDESHFNEVQRLALRLSQENALIEEGLQQGILLEDQAQARRLLAWKRFEDDKTKLAEKGEKGRHSVLQAGIAVAEGFTAAGGKKLFKFQKALSMAQAVASLPTAIIESFKNAGGYPWGIAPAAAMAATGAAQIASIRGSNIGSGGSVSGVGGGGSVGRLPNLPAPAGGAQNLAGQQLTSDQQINRTVVEFHFHGDVNGDENIKGLLEEAIPELADQDVILIPADSRNGIEINQGTGLPG